MLGLRFCARSFSSCGERGPLFIAVRGPLTIAASLVAEHRLQTRRLSNCGSRAQLLCGMSDPPRPGLEPVSPVLAGGFSTTAPPGKPQETLFLTSKDESKPALCSRAIYYLLSPIAVHYTYILEKIVGNKGSQCFYLKDVFSFFCVFIVIYFMDFYSLLFPSFYLLYI